MKKIVTLFLFLLSISSYAQELQTTGAYTSKSKDINKLYLVTNDYISITTFKDDKYINTLGGFFTLNGSNLNLKLEYYDSYPDSVGLIKIIPITRINNNQLSSEGTLITKLPNSSQALDGLWRISGRKSGETMNDIPKGDRKTIKILVDGYFQWIAINPAEKGFYGTGGGKYGFKDGKYSEDIIFFSRDNSRVGHHLEFDGAIKNNQWHHSGKSSKGDAIYEIWSKE